MSSTQKSLSFIYGMGSVRYLDLIEKILPKTANHLHIFMNDQIFDELLQSENFEISASNKIIARELIDKAHLAATAALFRTLQWARASVAAYDQNNFYAWGSAVRGLIENAGDIMDGLSNIPNSIAENIPQIKKALSGRMTSEIFGASSLEKDLDHFVLAKWVRAPKGERRKAKENIEYVKQLELGQVPKIIEFYHRLCGITHPSSASIDYLYKMTSEGLRLNINGDAKAIESAMQEFPNVLPQVLTFAGNPPLLILRVLHTFGIHPKLSELKELDWTPIPIWANIDRSLKKARL